MSSKNYRYKHIYSAVEDKAPSASTLMTGEIAVNGNAGNEKLFIKNSNNDVVSFDRIVVDSALNSGSTNPVANSAITSVIEDLEERKADWLSATTSGVVITATSGNTLEYFNRSGDTLFKIELPVGDAVKGDENTIHAEINPQNEKVVSSLVYVKKITTGLPETVKERYQLVGADGNPYTTASGNTSANIDIYKDSHIVSITYITDSGDTHWQNLEYKYIDASGDTQTEYVDISELVLEVEIGDGLEVQNHIVKGKIDPRQDEIVIGYNDDGTPTQTVAPLSVNSSGFTTNFIQDAINAKVLIDRRTFTPDDGEYNKTNQEITFKSILDDELFKVQLSGDTELNSGSTNFITNKLAKEEIEKRQKKNVELTQDEYDALVSAGTVDEETLYIITDSDPLDVSKFVTSGDVVENESAYTLSFSGESGDLFDIEIPKGDGKPILEGTDIKIVSGETADTIYVSADTEINSASTRVVQSKAIYDELEKKMDKQSYMEHFFPVGSVYITESYSNPGSWLGGTWQLIGGEDASKNYYPAFAISTDSAGTTISESLPNITGSTLCNLPAHSASEGSGAIKHNLKGWTAQFGSASGPYGPIDFNAASGNSVYQDGAQVNVNAIKLFFWKKTSGEIVIDTLSAITIADVVEEDNLEPVSSDAVNTALDGVKLQRISQQDYDDMPTHNPNVLYIIVDD